MFARAFIILTMVSVVPKVQAAAGFRGVVVANEIGGLPMANVQVNAEDANPNSTGADGKFTFTFPGRNPGESVRLTFRKEGYVVVNDVQLEVTLPANAKEKTAIFLLCKEGDRQEMASRFYRLKSNEAIEETYKKKFEEAQNATAAEVAKLRQERDQAKEAAAKAAEELAKQKPGGGSELYQIAMRQFLDGKVDQALDTLNDEKLKELSKAAKARKAEAEKATEEAVQNWLLKAQLLTVQFRFRDAEKAYQQAIDTSPDSFDANFAFARFNEYLKHYETATRTYTRCLELARRRENKNDIAITLNNLAGFDHDQNPVEAARKEYEEALKIFRELAKPNPDTYQWDVAWTLKNLADLDHDQNWLEAARKEYEEALKIRRELSQKNPNTYLLHVAVTLNNLAGLDHDENYLEAARKEYEEALKIYRELSKEDPDTYLPKLAVALDNVAHFDKTQNRLEAARKKYEEVLNIYERFAERNPERFQSEVARVQLELLALHK
jgi:tetratricopeptide (TPR) repeat protein